MTTTSRLILLWAASATPAFATGGVIVDSAEAGAEIFVDGSDSGMETPATLMGLSAGPHTVTVRSGCFQGETQVMITDEAVSSVTVELSPSGGTLAVQPIPPNAKLELDGKVLRGVPGRAWPVTCGPHTIRASFDGYLDTFITVDVGAGVDMVLPLQLDAIGVGSLIVRTTPPATLLLDDEEVGQSPLELASVQAGPHVIEARLEGHEDTNRQFVLEDGERLELELTLSPGVSGGLATVPSEGRVKPPKEGKSINGKRIAGYGLMAAGVGAGAVSLASWTQGRTAYTEYLDRAAAVNAGEQPAAYASDFYDAEVKGYKGPIYGSSVAALALLGGGITLAFVF